MKACESERNSEFSFTGAKKPFPLNQRTTAVQFRLLNTFVKRFNLRDIYVFSKIPTQKNFYQIVQTPPRKFGDPFPPEKGSCGAGKPQAIKMDSAETEIKYCWSKLNKFTPALRLADTTQIYLWKELDAVLGWREGAKSRLRNDRRKKLGTFK